MPPIPVEYDDSDFWMQEMSLRNITKHGACMVNRETWGFMRVEEIQNADYADCAEFDISS